MTAAQPPAAAAQPVVSVGTTSLQAALAMFGGDQEARPHRASCLVCGSYHVAAADEGQARHLVLTHIEQEHQLVDYWKAGDL